jgi:hypothetical protein
MQSLNCSGRIPNCIYALCSNSTAMAGYQTACMPSAVIILQCNDRIPNYNGRIPNYNGRIPNYNGRIPNYNGRIPNCMHALCSNLPSVAGYQTAYMHSAVTVLQWQDTKLHACTLQ